MEDLENKNIQGSEFIEDAYGYAFHGCLFMLIIELIAIVSIYLLIKFT